MDNKLESNLARLITSLLCLLLYHTRMLIQRLIENPSLPTCVKGITLTSMRRELQSQNRVNGDYEKTTGPIYLKF